MTQKCTGYLVRKAGYYHIVLAERFGKGRKLRWIRTGIRSGEPRYLELLAYELRCGEICGLRWEEINWDDFLLYINSMIQMAAHASSRPKP